VGGGRGASEDNSTGTQTDGRNLNNAEQEGLLGTIEKRTQRLVVQDLASSEHLKSSLSAILDNAKVNMTRN
jgi:hypothetical protein